MLQLCGLLLALINKPFCYYCMAVTEREWALCKLSLALQDLVGYHPFFFMHSKLLGLPNHSALQKRIGTLGFHKATTASWLGRNAYSSIRVKESAYSQHGVLLVARSVHLSCKILKSKLRAFVTLQLSYTV